MDVVGGCGEEMVVLIAGFLLGCATKKLIYEHLSTHQRPMKDQVQYEAQLCGHRCSRNEGETHS
jgi:hypothetical protein